MTRPHPRTFTLRGLTMRRSRLIHPHSASDEFLIRQNRSHAESHVRRPSCAAGLQNAVPLSLLAVYKLVYKAWFDHWFTKALLRKWLAASALRFEEKGNFDSVS